MRLKLTKFFIGQIHSQYYSGYSQLTSSNKYLLPIGSRNIGKLFHGSMKLIKGIEKPEDIGNRWMIFECFKGSGWLNGASWLQKDEERWWPKLWSQVNDAEAEQTTSTVATELKLDLLFDWREYSSFNRIRNSLPTACGSRQSKGTSQSKWDLLSRTKCDSICSKRKTPKCFEVDNK